MDCSPSKHQPYHHTKSPCPSIELTLVVVTTEVIKQNRLPCFEFIFSLHFLRDEEQAGTRRGVLPQLLHLQQEGWQPEARQREPGAERLWGRGRSAGGRRRGEDGGGTEDFIHKWRPNGDELWLRILLFFQISFHFKALTWKLCKFIYLYAFSCFYNLFTVVSTCFWYPQSLSK